MDVIELGRRHQGLTPERDKEIREAIHDYLWLPVVLLVSPMLLAALMTHWMADIADVTHPPARR